MSSVLEAWSDEARAAALEARRSKAKLRKIEPDLKNMFTGSERTSERAVRQPVAEFGHLYRHAKRLQPRFEKVMKGVAEDLSARHHGPDGGLAHLKIIPGKLDQHHVIVAPIKGRKRAKEKVEGKYGGDGGLLTDVVRGTVLSPSLADLPNALRVVRKHAAKHGFEIVKPENRFTHEKGSDVHTGALPSGYRDANVLLRHKGSGTVAELQLNHNHMYVGKEIGHGDGTSGHGLYEEERALVEKHGADLPPHVLRRVKVLQAQQRKIYARSHSAGLDPRPRVGEGYVGRISESWDYAVNTVDSFVYPREETR